MAITSTDKGWLEVNDEICRILGYTRNELLGKTWVDITHPDDLAADVAQFERIMAGEFDHHSMDKRFIRKDGQIIDGTISVSCVRRPDGQIDYFVVMLQDVTQRKHAEAALRESEQRLRLLGDNLPDSAVLQFTRENDGTPRFLYFSAGIESLCGVKVEDVLKDANVLFAQVTPESVGAFMETERLATTHFTVFDVEYMIRRSDGKERWMRVRSRPRRLDSGQIVWDGVQTDITAIKQAEQEIKSLNESLEQRVEERTAELERVEQQKRQLAEILEASPDLVGMADPEGRVLYLNQAFSKALGRSPERELLRIVDCHPTEANRLIQEEGLPTAARAGVWRGETEIVAHDGRLIPVSQLILAHTNSQGLLDYYSTIMRDMTERNQIEEELRTKSGRLTQANVDLARASRLKDEFLASMSHELRTPLTGILTMSETLQEQVYGILNQDQNRAVRDIEECGRHLLALINDILDVAKIEAGKIELCPLRFWSSNCASHRCGWLSTRPTRKTSRFLSPEMKPSRC